jgi:hypothetical protein
VARPVADQVLGEVLAAPPAIIPPLTQVRGTLISASLKTLGERGHIDRYYAKLPREHHDAIRQIIAATWVPEALALEHYLACDALELSPHEAFAIGAEVGKHVRSTLLGTVLSVAREAGTTPWVYLERLPRLFNRVCIGGAVATYRLGPKEARAEWYGLPGLKLAYFRGAFRGAQQSILELFCTKAYVSETRPVGGGDWAFRASWA